jgi:tetratricopeptide (TPR) repeat protein
MTFARRARTNADFTGVLFQMTIDPTISSVPFASLDHISYYSNEKEILFSMHTVFRIAEIKQIEDRLWQIDLTLTSGNDQQLKDLTDYIRKEIGGGTGWHRMGILMFKMGEFDKATEIYKTLIEKAPADNEAESAASRAATYSNIGLTYQNMGQYSMALSSFEKTLEIKRKYYPPNDSSLAITYNNIGMVQNSMGNFASAQSYYERAIEIWQNTLPPDHPSLAAVYNNLSAVY